MKKLLLTLTILCMFLPFGVMAEEYDTTPVDQVENNEVVESPAPTEDSNLPGGDVSGDIIDENVTMEDVENRLLKKLEDVVKLLQSIAKPLAIIMFVIGAVLMVIGAFGKRDGVKQGIIVCILSVVMYAITMYASPIITAVTNWIVS